MKRSIMVAVSVAALAAGVPAAMAQTSSGAGDISAPGPLSLAISNPTDQGTVDLQWAEPYDDTSNNNGTGTGSGGMVASRLIRYRADHSFATAADFTSPGATPVTPTEPGIAAGGTFPMNHTVTGLTPGGTYWFCIQATDDNLNVTYSNSPAIYIPLPPGGGGAGNSEGNSGNGCTAAPVRNWFSGLPGLVARKTAEGFSIIVLVGVLAGLAILLRRP